MSLARMEEVPVMHPKNLHQEAAAMTQNPSIQGLFGVVIFMWLVTFGFLVLAATWVLLRPQNTNWKKGLGINIEEL